MGRGVVVVGVAALAVMIDASSSHALDKCRAKVDGASGAILVDAKNVAGTLKWGEAAGQETNAMFNPGCQTGSKAKRCTLGAPGSDDESTPPPGCTLFLSDGVGTCTARVSGCTPGVRRIDFPGSFAAAVAAAAPGGTFGAIGTVEISGNTIAGTVVELDSITVDVPGTGTLAILLFMDIFIDCDSAGATSKLCGNSAIGICTATATSATDACGSSFKGIWHEDPDNGLSQNVQHFVTMGRSLPVTAGPLRIYVNGRSHDASTNLVIQSGYVVALFQPGGAMSVTNP